jgi:hypothetical protein
MTLVIPRRQCSYCSAVPERAAMEVMGWSHGAMAKRYQHMTAVLRQDIANRLDGFLWGPTETGTETDHGT